MKGSQSIRTRAAKPRTASLIDDAVERSMAELLGELVKIPSRAGIDSTDVIFERLGRWLSAHDVPFEPLSAADGGRVAIAGTPLGSPAAPAYVLNATVDTAGFGDLGTWTHDPVGAQIGNGWLFGRGSADSKAGVVIFCHLLHAFHTRGGDFRNALGFVFDADEHSGNFSGIKTFIDRYTHPIAGVLIGYPGMDRILIGARGFWRATLRIHGVAAHSGSLSRRGSNAIEKAARLVAEISRLHQEISGASDPAFAPPPAVTVTGISAGGDFSMIPDRCEVAIDVRLTPQFQAETAHKRIADLARLVDANLPTAASTEIIAHGSWPAYRLAEDSVLARALADAAEQVLGRRLPLDIAGPSNVGNFLAQKGIQATCGLGVSYRNVHAADEGVEVASLRTVFRIYELALIKLLSTSDGSGQ